MQINEYYINEPELNDNKVTFKVKFILKNDFISKICKAVHVCDDEYLIKMNGIIDMDVKNFILY